MNWLGLNDAAKLLRLHPVTLKRKAAAGIIPGYKPGRSWLFLEEHLAEWMRDRYAQSPQGLQGDKEKETQCHSIKGKVLKSTGLGLPSMASEYNDLVAQPARRKRRNSTTG